MRRSLAVAVVLMGFGGALVSLGLPDASAADPHIAIIDIDDAISPSTSRFLSRAIDSAADSGAVLLLVRLNTPGGLLDATRDMIDAITNARVPVVVYVAPTGAHAASAGTFIAAAAHVAAMAPITNIGAATPISVGGELPETLARKASQDAAALLRSISEARERNSDSLGARGTPSPDRVPAPRAENGTTARAPTERRPRQHSLAVRFPAKAGAGDDSRPGLFLVES